MGWASGSILADDVWQIVRPFIPVKHRQEIAKNIMEIFETEDADAFEDDQLIVQDASNEVDEDLEDI